MKKLLFKLMVVVIVLLAVPYYFLGGSLPLPGFLQGIFSGSAESNKQISATSVRTDRDVTVYKCVDEKGHTHFSEKPPVGKAAQTIELKTNTNLMQAVKVPESEQAEQASGAKVFSLGKSFDSRSDSDLNSDPDDEVSDGGLENPYTPEGVQKLIENAQNVSKMMDQRQQRQQQASDGMSGK